MFRNILKKAALALVLVGAIGGAAYALNVDQNRVIPARQTGGQVVNTYRLTINFNDPNIKTGQLFGTLPANSYILAIDSDVTTAFNAATTNVLTLGTTSASANELVADGGTATANISNNTTTIATGILHLTTALGLGVAISGGSTWTGKNMPLYAKYTQTGTAATTGSVTIVITYIPNADM